MTGAWQNSNRSKRLPQDWAKRRAVVLKRDGGVCYICGTPGANEVDHVVPGDDHSYSNLKSIHAVPCHQAKTIRERLPSRKRQGSKHPGLL